MRTDALLCSINDRLAGGPGIDIAPLGDGWIQDLVWLIDLEAERERKREKKTKSAPGSRYRAFSYGDEDDD